MNACKLMPHEQSVILHFTCIKEPIDASEDDEGRQVAPEQHVHHVSSVTVDHARHDRLLISEHELFFHFFVRWIFTLARVTRHSFVSCLCSPWTLNNVYTTSLRLLTNTHASLAGIRMRWIHLCLVPCALLCHNYLLSQSAGRQEKRREEEKSTVQWIKVKGCNFSASSFFLFLLSQMRVFILSFYVSLERMKESERKRIGKWKNRGDKREERGEGREKCTSEEE